MKLKINNILRYNYSICFLLRSSSMVSHNSSISPSSHSEIYCQRILTMKSAHHFDLLCKSWKAWIPFWMFRNCIYFNKQYVDNFETRKWQRMLIQHISNIIKFYFYLYHIYYNFLDIICTYFIQNQGKIQNYIFNIRKFLNLCK